MLSYSRGPDAPLIDVSIWEVFEGTAARFPDNEALVVRQQSVRLTFSELAAAVERTARGLTGLGLGAQDRIGVWATNCVEWVQLHLACARIGAVLVNVNPAYRSYELAFVLRKSGMKALFLWERDKRSDYRSIVNEAMAGQSLALEHVIYFGTEGWARMLAEGRDIPALRMAPDDVTNIQYTSGTTGSPKGVLLTHRNVLNNAAVIAEGLKISERDRIAVPVPLYHCFGCVIGTMVSVVNVAGDSRGTCHGNLWCADDVHCGAGASGVPYVRLRVSQNGADGGCAVSGGSNEACCERHAMRRHDGGVRADGKLADNYDVGRAR
jgi:fatty-acyl-CoA synthase